VINKIFTNRDGGIEFLVYLTPGSSREEITGLIQGGLKISVHARPNDNQANRALIELISSIFKIAKTKIIIKNGQKTRTKTVFIAHMVTNDFPQEVRDIVLRFEGIQNRLL
jgi:uncharacterized protein (TIGR00251 family)